jgi:hypothetical protein
VISLRTRSLAIALVAAVLTAIAVPAHALDESPIQPRNRPTALPGAVNGLVPSSMLITVGPNCVTARAAGPSLARIFAMARQAGVALGAAECYRSLAEEVFLDRQANQPGNNPACVAAVAHTPSGAPLGTSYHGWGKAVDLTEAGRSLTFSSYGYGYMKALAGSLGWNHPAFAEPGGSTCPEPWHWEWVGDGGNIGARPVRGDVIGLLPSGDDHGYATVTGLGAVERHGNFVSRGDASRAVLAWVMIGAASRPQRDGYWMVGSDGGVFAFGNARFRGGRGGRPLNAPINAMASTKTGNGYWLLGWDGGIFSFGDAQFYGSRGGRPLNRPIVAMAPTPTGRGYWLVASDGGIFAFGDARYRGSTGGKHLNSPIVGMAPTKTGNGYWLVAADGGIFAFGDAKYYGSIASLRPPSPTVSITTTKSGGGYWITLADGEVFGRGDAHTF